MAEHTLSKTFIGNRISYLRKKNNIKGKELSSILNVSTRTISLWEEGKTIPSLQNMVNICNLFKVSLDSFVSTI